MATVNKKNTTQLIGGNRAGRHYDKFLNTLPVDEVGKSAGLVDDVIPESNKVLFRSIEAGEGISVKVVDSDDNTKSPLLNKIVISAIEGAGGVSPELFIFVAPVTFTGQTSFPMPVDTLLINAVTINGLETTNWTFTLGPAIVVIDDVAEGFILEPDDEILIFYRK